MHIPLIPVGAAAALILILVFILLLWLLSAVPPFSLLFRSW
jgi:hypothetical protein